MKKFLKVLIFLIILSLIAAYIESSYCHFLTTNAPFGFETEDYIKHNLFCEVNSYVALPTLLLLIMTPWF